MKNIFKFFLAAFVGLFLFACSRDEDKVTIGVSSAGKVSSDKSSLVLNELYANAAALNFSWTEPIFNVSVVKTEALEFALSGNNFASPITFELPAGVTTASISHLQLNNILASLGLAPDVAAKVQVRLKTSLNKTVYYSEPTELTLTPYAPNPDLVYPKINVPGGYAGASGYTDWDPKNSPNLFSPKKDGKYYGFVYMNVANADAAQFKFAINQDWTGDKGDDGSFTGKLVEDGEKNIPIEIGQNTYYIKADWTANTYSMVKTNFGIIGEATPTGWNSDTDLTFNPQTHKFEIASMALVAGKAFKFRANDDWAIKIQPTSNDQQLVSGKAVQTYTSLEAVDKDPAYTVAESGNYKIELDLHNSAMYTIKVTKL